MQTTVFKGLTRSFNPTYNDFGIRGITIEVGNLVCSYYFLVSHNVVPICFFYYIVLFFFSSTVSIVVETSFYFFSPHCFIAGCFLLLSLCVFIDIHFIYCGIRKLETTAVGTM